MNDREALDAFGKKLIEEARDLSIVHWDKFISGEMKGTYAEAVRKMLASFDKQQLETLHELIPDIVDTAISAVLRMVDQEWIDISASGIGPEAIPSIRKISDGVEGDLYDWIPRFSKQRYKGKII